MTYAQGWSGEPPAEQLKQGGVVQGPPKATLPAGEQIHSLRPMRYPSGFERAVRVIRDLLACLALLLVSVLMALALSTAIAVIHRLDQVGDEISPDPGPAVTGCPFGDGQCGG